MVTPFRYLAADHNVLYGATVSSTAGSVDATYTVAAVCDGRGRPCRWTTGTAGASGVGATARSIELVVLHAHNLDGALPITISGGGGLSASGAAPPARRSGIPANPGILVTAPVSTTTVQFGVASNTVPVVLGEMLAGPISSVVAGLPLDGTDWGYVDGGAIRRQARFGTVSDLDLEQVQRWLRTTVFATVAEGEAIMEWYEASRNDTRPSAIVPLSLADVWVVRFVSKPQCSSIGGYYRVSLEFEEWPRTRW